MGKRVKIWNKIKLYETSAVGIPAYPDAHASAGSFSLVKALSNASLKGFVEEGEEISDDQLNLTEEKETMEENSQVEKVAEVKVEKTETALEKSVDMSLIVKAIKDGLKDGLKELETERGLVEKQAPTAVKSIGELAMERGLFVSK
jgi:hypothetical protein